ncbi:hypothetical protein [Nocardioides alcanivorans]|uniref:hypothetical protein n=1 Tax=Nocardioides alcanivorans TaxID=2897352 RepID=UPI001F26C0C6|nr:hypothetical protein [Nocardioides alcanivorans]
MTGHIEARGVVKTFSVRGSRQLVKAVNGVDIEIPRGKTLGLVGRADPARAPSVVACSACSNPPRAPSGMATKISSP